MHIKKEIRAPVKSTQSSLLVGQMIYQKIMEKRGINGKILASYLHRLMADPLLERKLSLLKPKKWKKHYQDEGQDLIPVYFYPEECDWARLSIISNATGFSRCYIFVYLMLLDLGVLKLPENRTQWTESIELKISQVTCSIFLDERRKILIRGLKTSVRP